MKCTVMAVVSILVLAFVNLLLWNWLVPDLFGGPVINYLQSLGLLLLTKIITWTIFSPGRFSRSERQSYWKNRMKEKLATLDPSEREAFREKIKEKWCRWEKQGGEGASND